MEGDATAFLAMVFVVAERIRRESDCTFTQVGCSPSSVYAVPIDRSHAETSRREFLVAVGQTRALATEGKKSGGVLLLHCTGDWSVLGCSTHKSVAEAQVRAEGIYRGISSQWVNANISPETFAAYLNELFDGQRCRMCGKRPDEVESMIQDGSTWVCDTCSG